MSIGRTILALLIVLSVAMLPASLGAGISLNSTDMTDMSAMQDMDCCPHQANPCDKGMTDCGSMAACALKCFSFSGGSFSTVVFPEILASVAPSFERRLFRSQISSPPFRPPRV
jgi:hypothetical protein